jgi:hypothetical protein
MAQVYGQPGKEWGDKLVWKVLHHLPDGCIVYSQPTLVYRSEVRYPDYVIVYHKWGVIVLEVKDWVRVKERDRKSALVQRRDGSEEWKTSPVDQARQAAHVLADMLEKDEDLLDYAGKRAFSYAYGGVLPHLSPSAIRWLEQEWGEGYLLGEADIRQDRITEKIESIPVPFRNVLMESQVRAICAIVDGRLKAEDRSTGEFKGVYDRTQESIAKEPLPRLRPIAQTQTAQVDMFADQLPSGEARIKHLEAEMPEEAAELISAPYVRLVRGFAGTGKTDVLILRAHYLHEQYPDIDILVTTFNDLVYASRLLPELRDMEQVDVIKFDTLCSAIYRKKHGRWIEPQDTGGLVARMAQDYPLIVELGQSFVTDEFIWMKEIGRTERQAYVAQVREGRGGASERTLTRKVKEQVFDLFEAYQQRLQDMPAYDWVDLHDKVLRYLQQGIEPGKWYDVILIDEAQHFAPTWMQIISKFLKPNGALFLCDDPSQSVYRYFSWLQKGVEVVGRTRWLRIPYRNTRQVFEAAYALIAGDAAAQEQLAEDNKYIQPNLDSAVMRDEPESRPQVHCFESWEDERRYVVQEIRGLISQGIRPEEIGILHTEKYGLDRYRPLVPKGVHLHEVKRQTGLEYKVVFISQIQKMVERTVGISWADSSSRQRRLIYMAMARARRRLYLLYEQQWPKVLEPIRSYVDWIEHTSEDTAAF